MNIKLTDQRGQTRGGLQWGEGVTHRIGGRAGKRPLCTDRCIHYYEGLGLALLHNPIGANFFRPRAWVCQPRGERRHEGLKSGATWLTTIREIEYVPPTTEQVVTCAILLALEVYDSDIDREGAWAEWAEGWLAGVDRSGIGARNAIPRNTLTAANYATKAAAASDSDFLATYKAAAAVEYVSNLIATYNAAAAVEYASKTHTPVSGKMVPTSHINDVAMAVFGY